MSMTGFEATPPTVRRLDRKQTRAKDIGFPTEKGLFLKPS
jgi:hypothetical protein